MFMKNFKQNQKIVVVGCGRFGASLASSLSSSGFDVIIIDKEERAFQRLSDTFGGFEIVGDATDLDTLESCGIADCNVVLVTTGYDNTNCMIAQIANIIYGIEQVYIRLNDPDKEKILKDTSIKAIYPARLSLREFENISHIPLSKELVL